MTQKELERELRKLYKETARVIEEKIKKHTETFVKTDAINAQKMSAVEYKAWRKTELQTAQWAKTLYKELEEDIAEANATAARLINESTKGFYAEGYNVGLYEIEKNALLKTSFDLCSTATVERLLTQKPNLLPKAGETYWGKRRVRNAITQAIIKGESIAKLSKRLRVVAGMEKKSAIRNARTIMTSAQNGGRQKVAEDAEEVGIPLKKIWIATLDERTRASHAEMDGVQIDVDEPFILTNNDGTECEMMFPADPDGDPEQVYNCRCTLGYNVDGNITSINPDEVERVSKIGSYDTWKNKR